MSAVVAVLAGIVAAQYVLLGLYVVPRLAATVEDPSPLIRAAQCGAVAFFVGCAMTHVGIAVNGAEHPGLDSTSHVALVHVLPHVAQIVGGAVFITVVARRLDVRFAPKDVAGRLRDAEARFRVAFDNAPSGMAVVASRGPDAGRFLEVNPALVAMVGLPADALATRSPADLAHPTYRDRESSGLWALSSGQVPELHAERRWVRGDGTALWVEIHASSVRDTAGASVYLVLQVRDVTQERLARRVGETAGRDQPTTP